MDAKTAIELIKNCQMKTWLNQDKYDAVIELIERQEKMLARACKEYSCAADCWNCNANTCKIVGAKVKLKADCAKEFAAWLQAEAGNELVTHT